MFISNLPEAIGSTSGLVDEPGGGVPRIVWMWVAIAVASGARLGWPGTGLFQDSPLRRCVAFVLTFAAGAILTMLANTMMPERTHRR